MIGTRSVLRARDVPAILLIVVEFSVIVLVLRMPLRNPELQNHNIGKSSQPPTDQLRSPEDNLTLWQFMSVTWMSPLISVGYSRQLNDDDVWRLAFEFQHRHLHDRFRELKGTVVRRLLIANGIDLLITTFLGILESLASKIMILLGEVRQTDSRMT